MTLVPVWAVIGLSWNLLSGYTGLVSFGHAAFFGLGAYTVALGQIHFDLTPWLMIPIAAVLGGIAGLLIGFPTFRLRGHYFALAMLAYPLACSTCSSGSGYQEVTLPMKRDNAGRLHAVRRSPRLHAAGAGDDARRRSLLTRAVERSRFGMALLAIKQNEAAAEAAGIDTLAWKLRAITLSGAIAGAVGGFYAVVLLVVTPQAVFGMLVSAQALTVAMFGGVGTVWGPVIGAVILVPLAETLQRRSGLALSRHPGRGLRPRHHLRHPARAGGHVLEGARLPAQAVGAAGCGVAEQRRIVTTAAAAAPVPLRPKRTAGTGDVVLEVRNLSRSFGGLKAVQDVSFKLRRNEILGIIGPNGAGKTTLFNLLNGFLRPDTGRDPARRPRHVRPQAARALRGRRRPHIPDRAAVPAHVGARTTSWSAPMSAPGPTTRRRQLAADALARVGLSEIADRIAGELTTKELRLMELARALAGQPRMLLLDETLAGLGHDEVDEVIAVIRGSRRDGMTIVDHRAHHAGDGAPGRRFLVLDHGAVHRRGRAGSRHARQPRHRGLSRQEVDGPCSRLKGSSAGYRRSAGAERRLDQGRRRASSSRSSARTAPARPRCSRPSPASCAPSAGPHHVRGPRPAVGRAARSAPHLGIAHVPEGRQVFPSLTVLENLEMGAIHRGRPARLEAEPRAHLQLAPGAGRAPRPVRRHAVGRRAADAGDRPRARLVAEAADAGRAVDGPGADHRRRDLRAADRDPPAIEADRSCWSSSAWRRRCNSPTTATCWKPGASCSKATTQTLRADDRVRKAYLGM